MLMESEMVIMGVRSGFEFIPLIYSLECGGQISKEETFNGSMRYVYIHTVIYTYGATYKPL